MGGDDLQHASCSRYMTSEGTALASRYTQSIFPVCPRPRGWSPRGGRLRDDHEAFQQAYKGWRIFGWQENWAQAASWPDSRTY